MAEELHLAGSKNKFHQIDDKPVSLEMLEQLLQVVKMLFIRRTGNANIIQVPENRHQGRPILCPSYAKRCFGHFEDNGVLKYSNSPNSIVMAVLGTSEGLAGIW
jgi:hypothetical protein